MKLHMDKKKIIRTTATVLVAAILCTALVVLASQDTLPDYGNITFDDMELTSVPLQPVEGAPEVEGCTAVAQSDGYILYVDPVTTAVALYNKADGSMRYTALPEAQLEEMKPQNADIRSQMQSNFLLTAVDTVKGTETVYPSYDESVANGTFALEPIPNGVKITYLVGEVPKERMIPSAMTEERFNAVLEKAGSSKNELKNRYRRVDIATLKDAAEKQEYLEKYPLCKEQVIYVLRPDLQEFVLDKLEAAFEEAGYTFEDKTADEEEVGAVTEEEMPEVFLVPMEFTLKDDVFSVRIDKAALKNSDAAIISSIQLTPYFLSASDTESGYFLLPDGSGSLMHFNNGKTTATSYRAEIYGTDPLFQGVLQQEKVLQAYLPVLGMSSQRDSLLAYIRSSAADASVIADVAGKTSGANYAALQFSIRRSTKDVVYRDWTAGAGTVYATRVQPGELTGDIRVDYQLLPAQTGYEKMAAVTRDQMIADGLLGEAVAGNGLLLDVLGAFDGMDAVAGFPMEVDIAMTSFRQAQEMVNELNAADIRLDMRYIGAVNGGYRQSVADKLKLESSLGSKKEAQQLQNLLEQAGGRLYYDVALTQVMRNSLFDSLLLSRDTVRDVMGESEALRSVDPVTFYFVNQPRYALSPLRLQEISTKLASSANKQGVNGLSLRYLGNTIVSDCNIDAPVFRSQAADLQRQAAGILAEQGMGILLSGGNAYALGSASAMADMPSVSNGYRITDESVPFYQMVVHGYLPYSYSAFNCATDPEKAVLESLATGARLMATVSYENTMKLKKTDYTDYYAASYENSREVILAQAAKAAPVWEKTADKTMEGYEHLTDAVTKTVFSGGYTLYVNTGTEAYEADGVRVDPMDYLLLEKGGDAQ